MRIRDPYAVAGEYRRAQLHCHTRRSDGRFEPAELARRYRDAGYSFVCFTDHDRLTRYEDANDASFLALSGVEETVAWGLRPFGPHLGRLLVDRVLGRGAARERIARTLAEGGVPVLHHPSWGGNLWTGAWTSQVMAALPGPFLVEVWNPHSHTDEDVRRWTQAVAAHGADVPVCATAADDCHTSLQFNRAWAMVKVAEVSAAALRGALLAGAFYASTGITAEFAASDGAITVASDADEVLVFASDGRQRVVVPGGTGRYAPTGDEGFVRLECRAGERRAWSQAFWITSDENRARPGRGTSSTAGQ